MASVASYAFRGFEVFSKVISTRNLPIVGIVVLLSWIWLADSSLTMYLLAVSITAAGWSLAVGMGVYYQRTRHTLAALTKTETTLRFQNRLLKKQIKKRTIELEQSQIEEMQQLYRLTELGQAGVSLLHDLANQLSVLALEVEGLEHKQQGEEVDRIKRVIEYLESIVETTRSRLHGEPQTQLFDLVRKVSDVAAFLQYKASKARVNIDWQPSTTPIVYEGDSARLCQVLAYVISNAIDAYGVYDKAVMTTDRRVLIRIETKEQQVVIKIRDWGKGISKKARKNLFQPFQSTKKTGLGLGLFIAKQIIETNFSGAIVLNPSHDFTEFIISLSLKSGGRQ